MSVTIKVALELTVSDTALEDAMAEYDELSVEGLIREILDHARALGIYRPGRSRVEVPVQAAPVAQRSGVQLSLFG